MEQKHKMYFGHIVLFMWYNAQGEHDVPISGVNLVQKVLSLNKKLPDPEMNFIANQERIECWTGQLTVTSEDLSNGQFMANELFKKVFDKILLTEELTSHQIYNVAEIGHAA